MILLLRRHSHAQFAGGRSRRDERGDSHEAIARDHHRAGDKPGGGHDFRRRESRRSVNRGTYGGREWRSYARHHANARALTEFTQALKLNPNDMRAREYRAVTYGRLHRYPEARHDIVLAIRQAIKSHRAGDKALPFLYILPCGDIYASKDVCQGALGFESQRAGCAEQCGGK